jgi:hypothetical protein
MGAIINANIFGELAVLVAQMNQKTSSFQEKLTQINTAIKNEDLPIDLEEKIRDHIVVNWDAAESQFELKEFMMFLGPSIRREVITEQFGHIIRSHDVFEGMFDKITYNLNILTFKPDEFIIIQGEQT